MIYKFKQQQFICFSQMSLMLPGTLGLAKLSRFERCHLIGIIVLRERAQGRSITDEAAEAILMSGNCSIYLQRNYSDNSSAIFEILEDGYVKHVSDS